MRDLQVIMYIIEKYLIHVFRLNCIEEVKNYINKNYLIGYEIFEKQIVFEIFYANYMNNIKETKTLMDIYKRKIKQDEGIKSYECVDDKEYTKLKRKYKEFRIYNDILAIEHKKENEVQYIEIGKEDTSKKMDGQKIKEYQENQLLDINEFKIFKYLKDGRISDSKSLDNYRLINGLKEIDSVYERIKTTYNSYFEKSIQYFQLEQNCRIETNYLIAYAMNKVKRNLNEKKNDIKQFQCFWGVNNFQNKFIIGIEKYIDEYIKNPQIIVNIPQEIYELSLIKYNVREGVVKYLDMNKKELDYINNDDFFKNYFGEEQHVIREKNWEDIKLKNFRELYQKI